LEKPEQKNAGQKNLGRSDLKGPDDGRNNDQRPRAKLVEEMAEDTNQMRASHLPKTLQS